MFSGLFGWCKKEINQFSAWSDRQPLAKYFWRDAREEVAGGNIDWQFVVRETI